MKEKLIEAMKKYGIIIVDYSEYDVNDERYFDAIFKRFDKMGNGVLFKITKEDELIYLGESSSIYSKIKFNNKNGWVDTSFLTKNKFISEVFFNERLN
jgi:hypothetical protein